MKKTYNVCFHESLDRLDSFFIGITEKDVLGVL